VREHGKSLLPPGVNRCEGEFATGDVVRICDLDGTEFAGALRALVPRPFASTGCPRKNWFIATIWSFYNEKKLAIEELLAVMAKLRSPTGCPWDREQDHQSLRRHAIEESLRIDRRH